MKRELLSVATVLAFTMGGSVYLQARESPPVNMGLLDKGLYLSLIDRGATSPDRAVNLNTITLAGGGGCASTHWGNCHQQHTC